MPEAKEKMPYDHFEHRHRFAAWAAARATQRGFTSTSNLLGALNRAGVREFLQNPSSNDCRNQEAFDDLHRKWCSCIVAFLHDEEIGATYGRAAKLVAVYLKAMVVILPDGTSDLARFAHPPIDRVLLQNISRCDELKSRLKSSWRNVRWTQLDSDAYYELIKQLRGALNKDDPWWKLEKYWTVTNDLG